MSQTILILAKLNTMNSQVDVKNNSIQNLFRNLQKDLKSMFCSVGNLSKSILNKANKSLYEKDKVFVNSYNQLEDKIFIEEIICFLLRHLLIKRMILIIQQSIVFINLLNYYMLTLQIRDFWQNLLLIQNIVFYWLIYLLQKYTFIQ